MSKEPAFRGSGGMVPQEYFISWSLQRQVQHCESIVLVHNTPVIEKLCILISEVSYPLHHSLLISSNAFYNFFFGGRNNYCGSLGRGLSTLGPTPHLPCNGSQESCMLFSMKRTFVPKHTLENNSCSFWFIDHECKCQMWLLLNLLQPYLDTIERVERQYKMMQLLAFIYINLAGRTREMFKLVLTSIFVCQWLKDVEGDILLKTHTKLSD